MKKYAMLIDVENISDRYIKGILSKVSSGHQLTYRRIYGDFTKPSLSAWKNLILENSLVPMQQYSYTTGKNSTDSAMVIDAMDILYTGNVDGFYIISSDSDFTKLATRLRESGMDVIGMGEGKTPQSFRKACEEFIVLDEFARSEINIANNSKPAVEKPKQTNPKPKADNKKAERKKFDEFVKKMVKHFADKDGNCDVAKLGKSISDNGYSVKTFGYDKVVSYLKNSNTFKLSSTNGKNGVLLYTVKIAKNQG